ncbi:MAG: hypothetical protein A3H64_00450 [Candidatus Ryanbacteria bacterium RIFCSPLOWO2_02_FULL_45_11c]|uniref:Helicase C-terminal domain-containing protein n=1 Tax=Candidatus Ryanbacteria bacterium RIFCSPLOWO2_02_FULL_45_11c TaxID=1802128 RepID=A0A1G2GV34_9BACT|nr:MAG: hypothetical protein A3H64_00450 [Candidatus Ryanbacteria bacterium RIFCSPLOWO2_02_FULL_45_11c]
MTKKRFLRVVVIAPTRSTCLNISIVLSNGAIPQTLLMQEKGKEIFEAVDILGDLGGFGVVAGTGTGKTVALRDITKRLLGEQIRVDIVTRENEATDYTWMCNVLVVTPGVALHWLKSGIIGNDDLIVVDEIHQTSEHLELSLGLAKRAGCTFLWMSATIDPRVYEQYLEAATVVSCSAYDPVKKAEVKVEYGDAESFLSSHIEEFVKEKRGTAVFIPTRAQAENLSRKFASREGLYCDFYHGGEKVEKLRQFLKGEVEKPFMVFMTIAGASSLNIAGLDTVVIIDEMYDERIHSGVAVMEKVALGNNELLQMGGRVNGRAIGGKVYILSRRSIDFHSLKPETPHFRLGGDPQHLALVCARLGVDVSELDLITTIDRGAYEAHVKRFRDRGIIAAEDFCLTPYGEKVERLPVTPDWAEILVHAEESQDSQILNLAVVCASAKSLYDLIRKEHDFSEVGVKGSDHLTAHNIVVSALSQFGFIRDKNGDVEYGFDGDYVKKYFDKSTRQDVVEKGVFIEWCDLKGFNGKAIKEATLAMKSIYRQMRNDLPRPKEFGLVLANTSRHETFLNLLAEAQSLDFVRNGRHSKAGTVFTAQHGMLGYSADAVLGTIRYWKDKRGYTRSSIEGTEIPIEVLDSHSKKIPTRIYTVSAEGVKVEFRSTFAGVALDETHELVPDEKLPESLQAEARQQLSVYLPSLPGFEKLREHNQHVRKTSGDVAIRSGGKTRAATQQDEQNLYLRSMEAANVFSYAGMVETLRSGKIRPLDLFLNLRDFVSEEEEIEVASQNPDMLDLLGKQYPVTYRQGYAPSIELGKAEADDTWKQLPDSGIKLPSGCEVVVVVPLDYHRLSASDISKLKEQVCEYLNQKKWDAFTKPEISLPSATDEVVPDVVEVEYGTDSLIGGSALKFGAVTLNTSYGRSSDFKGEWFKTREEAEAARAKAHAKLDATKVERFERAEYMSVREKAEPIKARISELYDKQYYNSDLDQDLRRRIYERYTRSLPSTSAELKQWVFETEVFIAEVEKAVAEVIRKKIEEQQKLREAEEREQQNRQYEENRRTVEKAKRRAKEEKFAETGVLADEDSSGFNSFAAALAVAKQKKQKR